MRIGIGIFFADTSTVFHRILDLSEAGFLSGLFYKLFLVAYNNQQGKEHRLESKQPLCFCGVRCI